MMSLAMKIKLIGDYNNRIRTLIESDFFSLMLYWLAYLASVGAETDENVVPFAEEVGCKTLEFALYGPLVGVESYGLWALDPC